MDVLAKQKNEAEKGEGKEEERGNIHVRSPFIKEVLEFAMPLKFRMPTIETYHGRTNPWEHLETDVRMMQLHRASDQILCGAFPTMLKGTAREWYHQLALGMIKNFDELAKLFATYFVGWQRTKKSLDYLRTVR